MNEIETTFNRIQSRFPQRGTVSNYHKPNYKQKLARATTAVLPAQEAVLCADPDNISACTQQTTRALDALTACKDADCMAFQSVAVAALRTLNRAHDSICQAGRAAISLNQQTKIDHIADSLGTTTHALEDILSDKGNRMRTLGINNADSWAPDSLDDEDPTWWFALSEAIQTVDAGINWLTSLVAGQPEGTHTRTLSSLITGLLRTHHDALLQEAEAWMQG